MKFPPELREPQPLPAFRGRAGFTFVELLIVITVVAVLMVLLFGAGQMVVQKSRNTACLENLRQMSAASAAYGADHGGAWPRNNTAKGDDRFYFSTEICPYLNLSPEMLKNNLRSVFVCPADREGPEGLKGVYRSVGYPLSYGQNAWLGSDKMAFTAGQRRGGAMLPSQLMVMMDFEGHWVISSSTMTDEREESLRHRHNGHLNVAYADGHIAPAKIEEFWGKGGDSKQAFPFFQGRE